MRDIIKIALAQINSKQDKQVNLQKYEELTLKAKNQGADLIIFPEMSLTGYIIKDQIYELAEYVPGVSVEKIEKIAKKTGVNIIFGLPEMSSNAKATLYNTAVFVSPEGYMGKYHKMYLPTHSVFEEKRYFRPGYQPFVLDTNIGKIGLTICYDIYFPEVFRLARLSGAQLIVCISASPAVRKNYFETLIAARAIENTAYVAFVNFSGIQESLQFWGGSCVVGPSGDVLAKAKYDEEDFICCEIDFQDLRAAETFIPILRDLRPEFFSKLKRLSENI
ncbi:MAG: carbon-nitrogen hydrolase family protein [Candidatus Bathyarchaeota archaeon]|nr:carbon-nitrogen hydrolase family protein [Candidatus Termiticorpusculum sp.]